MLPELFARTGGRARQKPGEAVPERQRQLIDLQQRRVSDAPFYLAEGGAIHPGVLGKFFLR